MDSKGNLMTEPNIRDYSDIYRLGRSDELERILRIINQELELHSKGSSGRGTVERIKLQIERNNSNDKTVY